MSKKITYKINDHKNEHSSSFKDAFSNYYSALCFFSCKLVNNRANAEDIVQNVFIKLWEKHPDFNSYKNIKALLYISVRNACFDFIKERSRSRSNLGSFSYFLEQQSEEIILNEITRAEVLREVNAEIEKLPLQNRKVAELYFLEGWSYEKIAAHLEISINTVRNHKAKAVRLLRQKLGMTMLVFLAISEHL